MLDLHGLTATTFVTLALSHTANNFPSSAAPYNVRTWCGSCNDQASLAISVFPCSFFLLCDIFLIFLLPSWSVSFLGISLPLSFLKPLFCHFLPTFVPTFPRQLILFFVNLPSKMLSSNILFFSILYPLEFSCTLLNNPISAASLLTISCLVHVQVSAPYVNMKTSNF